MLNAAKVGNTTKLAQTISGRRAGFPFARMFNLQGGRRSSASV